MKAVPLKRQHEHEFEPQYGLPEKLPEGERILWQGRPQWRSLALRAYHWRKLAVYFGALLLWQLLSALHDGQSWRQALAGWAVSAPVFAIALALVAWWARLSAHTTAYTITNKRIVMRMGIVLGITYNLPFSRIAGADLGLHGAAARSGDVSLQLAANERIALFHLWPHARPWAWARAQPTLRCIADAPTVARLLTEAWTAARHAEGQASPKPGAQAGRANAADAAALAGGGQWAHG